MLVSPSHSSGSEALPPFMKLSPEDNSLFWLDLFRSWRESYGFGCKSVFGKDIDLFGDCIERNLSLDHPCLSWHEQGDLVSVSYSQVANEVEGLASRWLANSIQEGESVCIICDHPYRRLVSLLCAFRLGLIPLLINPTGPVVIQSTLDANPQDHLHVEPSLLKWIPEALRSSVLDLTRDARRAKEACRYSSSAVALRLPDPFSSDMSALVELTAQDLFLRLIRDGHSILRLQKGSRMASYVDLQDSTSPFTELMALLCGASLICLNGETPESFIRHLMLESLEVIGISPKMMQPLMEAQLNTPRTGVWERWFRSPLVSHRILEWQNFTKQLDLEGTPHADLQWTASSAGIAFGSEWSTNLFDFDLYPAPGQSWYLGDVAAPLMPTKGSSGRYVTSLNAEDKPIDNPTPFILLAHENAHRFLGCYPTGRAGMAFPEELVYRCVELPLCWHTIIELPVANGSQFVLLAFMDPRSKSDLNKIIQENGGEFALPDQIEIIPYVPKLNQKGEIDAEWAKRLYLRGEFERRSKIPVYKALSKVRMLALTEINV